MPTTRIMKGDAKKRDKDSFLANKKHKFKNPEKRFEFIKKVQKTI